MRPAEQVVVIGAGGHGKVVVSALRAAGHDVAAVFDDTPAKWGTEILGVRVVGPVAAIAASDYERGVIAIGDNRARQAIASTIGLIWLNAIHPRACIDASAAIGPGTVVCAGAIVQPDAVIGAHAIINTGVIVEHDCQIGDCAQIASGTCLAGGVRIDAGAFLGVGVSVIPGGRVGAWSVVGAGSVVVREIPAGVVAFGVPARPRRTLERL